MRIDLNSGIGQTPDLAEPSKSSRSSSTAPESGAMPSDVAKLSSDYVKVQALAAAIGELPEIRQDKVAALAESIRSGTYAVSAEQTAEALYPYAEGRVVGVEGACHERDWYRTGRTDCPCARPLRK